MNEKSLENLLNQVKNGDTSIPDALNSLKKLPYEQIGDEVRLDNHRGIRCGYPEVIFGAGKSDEQLLAITERVLSNGSDLIISRVQVNVANIIRKSFPQVTYHSAARMLTWSGEKKKGTGNVMVLSGGTADIPVAEEAAITAEMMGASVERVYDVGVAGLHRLLDKVDLIQNAHVLVVVAGMEGALPSVVAGLVSAPVIAVPTSVGYGASFNGLAALLAMLNSCASGVSVVNIDNGFGAGYQAALINRQCETGNRDHD